MEGRINENGVLEINRGKSYVEQTCPLASGGMNKTPCSDNCSLFEEPEITIQRIEVGKHDLTCIYKKSKLEKGKDGNYVTVKRTCFDEYNKNDLDCQKCKYSFIDSRATLSLCKKTLVFSKFEDSRNQVYSWEINYIARKEV
jgi:hypothetical protein